MREALVGVYPGTFDPITNGHMDIIAKAIEVVDILIVAVATNTLKIPMFSVDDRIKMIEHDLLSLADGLPSHKKVIAISLDGLLVDFVRKQKSNLIVRGLRAVSDFEYEFQLASMNRQLNPDLDSLFMTPSEKNMFISSTLVKEVARHGGDVSNFVAPNVLQALQLKLQQH